MSATDSSTRHDISCADLAKRDLGRSPSLQGALRRAFGADLLPFFERYFSVALEAGGNCELGFEREAGMNFNPRPARAAMILLNDAHEDDRVVVAAAMLGASLWSIKRSEIMDAKRELDQGVRSLAAEVVDCFFDLSSFLQITDARVRRIVVALVVDFLRHLHQVQTEAVGEKRDRLHVEIAEQVAAQIKDNLSEIYEWARIEVPGVAIRLNRWMVDKR